MVSDVFCAHSLCSAATSLTVFFWLSYSAFSRFICHSRRRACSEFFPYVSTTESYSVRRLSIRSCCSLEATVRVSNCFAPSSALPLTATSTPVSKARPPATARIGPTPGIDAVRRGPTTAATFAAATYVVIAAAIPPKTAIAAATPRTKAGF